MKLKLKLKKSKAKQGFKFNFSVKLLYTVAWLIFLGAIGYVCYFWYENFYGTVAQTEEIILLRSEVAPDIIDTNRVDKVLNNLNEKTSATSTVDINKINNPFVPNTGPVPEASTQDEEETPATE